MIPAGTQVTVWREAYSPYPARAPFDPGRDNAVYRAVENCWRLAGMDAAGAAGPAWNPLGECIAPGETVLLKPNWVKAEHPRPGQADWECVVTHPSVLRAVADYCFRAAGRTGRVIAADAPQTDSSWETIAGRLQLRELEEYYRRAGWDFSIVDLRQEEWRAERGVIVERRALAGDPLGYAAFDLAGASEFARHGGGGRYYGADYDQVIVNRHHTGGRHEYLLAATAVAADVVISLPKLKTHKKTGITAGLKNLVGVNGDKNWLPHHTEPGWGSAGDERPVAGTRARLRQLAERGAARWIRAAAARWPALVEPWHGRLRSAGEGVFGETDQVVRSGNWHGNDTCWRMCLDLNKLVLYGNPDGTLRRPGAGARKRYLVVADGWLAGEGAGPMNPDPVRAGVILFARNPASADAAACVLMGFDPERVPIVRQAFRVEHYRLAEGNWTDIELRSNVPAWNGPLGTIDAADTLRFRPHAGWKDAIESASAGRPEGVLVA